MSNPIHKNQILDILIAEDSDENITTLKMMLNQMPLQFNTIDVSKTLKEAEEALKSKSYDLALLDIQFKHGTIFHTLEKLNKMNITMPSLVFVTAHGSFDYATKAIQYACLDFLNKPFKFDRLLELVTEIQDRKRTRLVQQEQLTLLLDLIEGDLRKPSIIGVIRTKNRIEYIKFDELRYIKANGTTSTFHTMDKEFESVRHLGYYIDLFKNNTSIIQVSRSCVVNKSHIKSFNSKDRQLELQNGEILSVSVRAAKNFRFSKSNSSIGNSANPLDRIKNLLFRKNR